MKRKLFTLVSALLLLLFLTATVLWIRSYFVQYALIRYPALAPGQTLRSGEKGFCLSVPGYLEREVRLISAQRGSIVIHRATWNHGLVPSPPLVGWQFVKGYPPEEIPDLSYMVKLHPANGSCATLLGFQSAQWTRSTWALPPPQRKNPGSFVPPSMTYRTTVVPLWMVALSCCLPLLIRLTRGWKRKVRRAYGQCQTCGYPLIGNTSGTCPECGTPVLNSAGTA